MKNTLLRAAIFSLACGVLVPEASAQMPTRVITLGVVVTPQKANGAAWDALGGAPDIAICINSALGQQCFAAGNAVYASPSAFGRGRCQDSFACTFTVTVPATGPVSLSVYDVDISEHDLIGSCAVTPTGAVGIGACGRAVLTVR